MRNAILCILRGYEKVRLNRNAQLNFDIGFFPIKKDPIKPTSMLIAIENAIAAKLATIPKQQVVNMIRGQLLQIDAKQENILSKGQ